MRILWVMSLLAAVVIINKPTESEAACNTAKRYMVAQPDDLIFTAAVAETKLIPVVYAAEDTSDGDCDPVAVSSITGVLLESTYACGTLCAIGQTAVVGAAVLGTNTHLFQLEPPTPPDTVGRLEGAVPVHYNGSATAGTTGTITFYRRDSETASCPGLGCTAIGTVNVYVVAPGPQPQTWFKVSSAVGNVSGDTLIIDHPLLNGKPSARVFVQHSQQGTFWNHPVAAFYQSPNWRIRNEDAVTMPTGLTFNVRIDPSALRLRTKRPSEGSQGPFIQINDPRTNNNPFATIIATPFTAGTGSTRRSMNHPYSVAYDGAKWQVRFSDGANMPPVLVTGSRTSPVYTEPGFFIKIITISEFVDDNLFSDPSGFTDTHLSNGAGVDIVGVSRTSGPTKIISPFCWSIGVNNPMIATLNWTPLPPPAPNNYNWIESKYYGVGFLFNNLTVFHEDGTFMDGRTPFNLWAPNRTDCPPVPLRYRPPTGL